MIDLWNILRSKASFLISHMILQGLSFDCRLTVVANIASLVQSIQAIALDMSMTFDRIGVQTFHNRKSLFLR